MTRVNSLTVHEARLRAESYALGRQHKADELRVTHELELREEYARGQREGLRARSFCFLFGLAAGSLLLQLAVSLFA